MSLFRRLLRQSRGQTVQLSSRRSSAATRCCSTPARNKPRYDGSCCVSAGDRSSVIRKYATVKTENSRPLSETYWYQVRRGLPVNATLFIVNAVILSKPHASLAFQKQ